MQNPSEQVDRTAPERKDLRGANRHASPRRALLPALGVCAVAMAGGPDYVLSIAERVRHPWHPWLRPSGYVGQTAGILCLVFFAFLWLYPLRKRAPWLSFTGSVAGWLDVHIVAGLLLPLLGAVHAAWNFTGVIGLGYLAMCVVVLSGVVGRYLYVRIPRHKSGLELSREEAKTRRRELITSLSTLTRLPPADLESMLAPRDESAGGLLSTAATMIRDDFSRRAAVRRLATAAREGSRGDLSAASARELLSLARKEMALAQQIRLLDRTHRAFRFWHAAHKPVAISAFLAVVIHVAVVVAVGTTWFG